MKVVWCLRWRDLQCDDYVPGLVTPKQHLHLRHRPSSLIRGPRSVVGFPHIPKIARRGPANPNLRKLTRIHQINILQNLNRIFPFAILKSITNLRGREPYESDSSDEIYSTTELLIHHCGGIPPAQQKYRTIDHVLRVHRNHTKGYI